jgi:hypothetical protein
LLFSPPPSIHPPFFFFIHFQLFYTPKVQLSSGLLGFQLGN